MVMADLFLHALTAAIGDLGVGLAFVAILVLIAWLIRGESRAAHQEKEAEVERVDPWASFPPKWVPPRAESDLGSERKVA
jgi:hypothetical protein